MVPSNEYDVMQPGLERFLRRNFHRLGGQDIEDVSQQAWLTLHRHREVEGKPVAKPFPFLCQAGRWAALALMRAERRCQPVPEIPEGQGPVEATPEVVVERILSERHMAEFLRHVPAKERELAELVIAGEPRERVEEKLGVSRPELEDLWDDTCARIISKALAQPGSNPLRQAILRANLEDRLDTFKRTALDRAAAANPDLCLELAASL